jgi:hypothetical protein
MIVGDCPATMPDAGQQTRPTVANAGRVEQVTRAATIAPQIAANEKTFQNGTKVRVFFAPRWKMHRPRAAEVMISRANAKGELMKHLCGLKSRN